MVVLRRLMHARHVQASTCICTRNKEQVHQMLHAAVLLCLFTCFLLCRFAALVDDGILIRLVRP